ncbi:MAG: hypothetical protein ACLTYN_15940 [Dysosmobacter welbionis]
MENLKQAQQLGYTTVFWSLAYVDWNTDDQPSAEEAYAKLLPRIHDGPSCCSTLPPPPTPRSWMTC